jgi:hypothetical protein
MKTETTANSTELMPKLARHRRLAQCWLCRERLGVKQVADRKLCLGCAENVVWSQTLGRFVTVPE